MNSLPTYAIKTLYAPALAEGEGVGTAYEYFAKRLVLAPWLREISPLRRILVAGLPEKYGASLDFLLLARDLGAEVLVVDERPSALQRLQDSLTAWRATQPFGDIPLRTLQIRSLTALAELDEQFDLAISSEVLQRLPAPGAYVRRLGEVGTAVAIFCPNADNPAHTDLSGLSGLRLEALETLVAAALHKNDAPENSRLLRSGFIDMPPFPPGIVRSEAQREQAGTGRLEALAMWGLAYYARMEKFLPTRIRRRQSHIVYCLTTT
jgi:hypothetical protein